MKVGSDANAAPHYIYMYLPAICSSINTPRAAFAYQIIHILGTSVHAASCKVCLVNTNYCTGAVMVLLILSTGHQTQEDMSDYGQIT